MGVQEVVQPGGPGSFLTGDMHVSAQPVDKLQKHARFRLDDTFHHDLPGTIQDRNRNAFLSNVVQAGVCAVTCERLLGDFQNAPAIPLGTGARLTRGKFGAFVGIKKM